MIVDRLESCGLYAGLEERVRRGLEYLVSFDPTTPDGRYEVAGEELVAIVQSYETGPSTEKRFETHRRHIDIQYVVTGRERILHTAAAGLEVEVTYDEGRDVEFYHDPPASSSILVAAGDFAVFYPHDAHKPGCMAGGRDPVRKVVVKVLIPV